jgi:hypothetical protein
MSSMPDTRYAKSGDTYIAYQVMGDGPFDLVLVPGFITHLEHFRLDVNRNSNRGFPRACKSDSGCSDGNGGVARWPGDIRTT